MQNARMSAAALLLCLLGCDAEFEPGEPGPTGYLSDVRVEPGVDPGARPDYAALWRDGRLDVAAVFGQMDPGGLTPDDDGRWSVETFVLALERRSFTLEGDQLDGRIDGRAVRVTLYRPEAFSLERPEADRRDVLREALAEHEVVYINGHAFQSAWDVLDDPSAYRAHYRVVVLDVCWSWQLYVRPVLGAQRGGRRAHVVSSTNRVVTGSVHSFLWLLDDLAGARESWRVTIAGMNALAARRASDRRAHVEPHLQAAERYGVSGL